MLNENYFQMSIDSWLNLTDNQYQQDDKARRLVLNKLTFVSRP